MSLGKFVKFLILLLQRERIDLSLHDRSRWHLLFYQLKRLPKTPGRPVALEELLFDWDGPHPVCRELAEYLSALCMTGCVNWSSPDFRKYWLPEEMAVLWSKEYDGLGEEEKHFLASTALELARKEFSSVAV
jgi:hypothetical protein